ncbi:unnamed protein product [Peniophora sp. CBMAI 1063]|nr:unnamed protein product [Peniophora sp. CBMAI 1063]
MPIFLQPTFPHCNSMPGEADVMPPFRTCDFNHATPHTTTNMLRFAPVLDAGDADDEETGSASSDEDEDDQSERAEDTPCSSRASPYADEGGADPQSNDAGADEPEEGREVAGVNRVWGPEGMENFLYCESSLDPFLQATHVDTSDLGPLYPPLTPSSPPAPLGYFNDSEDFKLFDFDQLAPAPTQPTAGPSFTPYNFDHGYPSDATIPIATSLPIVNANSFGMPSDQNANLAYVNLADQNLATLHQSYDVHPAAGGMPTQAVDSWQSSGVLPQPQDSMSLHPLWWQEQLHTGGSSAVPPILPPSQPGIAAPRPQRAWDTPTVLSNSGVDAALGITDRLTVSAPAELPVKADGSMQSASMIAQTHTQMCTTHIMEAQTWLQYTSHSQVVREHRSETVHTSHLAPPGPQRTQRQHARITQGPYRTSYCSRRQSVDALLNRLHPEPLAVLEHAVTNMASPQMHAQM